MPTQKEQVEALRSVADTLDKVHTEVLGLKDEVAELKEIIDNQEASPELIAIVERITQRSANLDALNEDAVPEPPSEDPPTQG